MPFQPTAFMDSRYTHDLTPDRAKELAILFGVNAKTTIYVLQRQEGDPGVGDGCGVLVGDFPIGATLTAIVTPMGTLDELSPPLTLSAADMEMQRRAGTGEPVAVLHWRKEGGIYRVARLNPTVIAAIAPKLDTWIAVDTAPAKTNGRKR